MKPYHCRECHTPICTIDQRTVAAGALTFVLPRNGFTVVCGACGAEQRVFPPAPEPQRLTIRPLTVESKLRTR